MRHAVAVSVALLASPGAIPARAADADAEAVKAGAVLYKIHCQSCHGASGRGDGKAAPGLEFVPADLTRISQRNKGRFPFDRVAKIVDGREGVKGHGGTDMPAWGDVLLSEREGYDQDKVKEQIRRLVHYLASIQEKPAKS